MKYVFGEKFESFFMPSWQSSTSSFWTSSLTPLIGGTLVVLGYEVHYTGSDSFDFYTNRSVVWIVDVNADDPAATAQWRMSYQFMPNTGNLSSAGLDAVLVWNPGLYVNQSDAEAMVYMFGSITKSTHSAQVLSRILWSDLIASQWQSQQFYSNDEWVTGFSIEVASKLSELWSPNNPGSFAIAGLMPDRAHSGMV
jgi:hypothetical protein